MDATNPLSLSRRDLAKFAAVTWLLAASPLRAASPDAARTCRPVVGFFNDAPWLDLTGRDLAYSPPSRGIARVPDCESLMRQGHFL